MTWRITFANGDSEETPSEVDKMKLSVTGDFLYGMRTTSYGPDAVIVTYVMQNVRSWTEIK